MSRQSTKETGVRIVATQQSCFPRIESSRNRGFHRAKTPKKNETMEKGLEIDFVELRVESMKRKEKKGGKKKE